LETKVSFADWVKNGGLIAHKLSRQEIANLLGIVARDLKDSRADGVSDNWGFAFAVQRCVAGRDDCARRRGLRRLSGEPSLSSHARFFKRRTLLPRCTSIRRTDRVPPSVAAR